MLSNVNCMYICVYCRGEKTGLAGHIRQLASKRPAHCAMGWIPADGSTGPVDRITLIAVSPSSLLN